MSKYDYDYDAMTHVARLEGELVELLVKMAKVEWAEREHDKNRSHLPYDVWVEFERYAQMLMAQYEDWQRSGNTPAGLRARLRDALTIAHDFYEGR